MNPDNPNGLALYIGQVESVYSGTWLVYSYAKSKEDCIKGLKKKWGDAITIKFFHALKEEDNFCSIFKIGEDGGKPITNTLHPNIKVVEVTVIKEVS